MYNQETRVDKNVCKKVDGWFGWWWSEKKTVVAKIDGRRECVKEWNQVNPLKKDNQENI